MVTTLDEALRILKNAVRQERKTFPVGLVGKLRGRLFPSWAARRGVVPEHSHRSDFGARSAEWIRAERHDARRGRRVTEKTIPRRIRKKSLDAMAAHVEGMLRLQEDGIGKRSNYGNNNPHFCVSTWREKMPTTFPGFRTCLHSSAVLRRTRALSLGGRCRERRTTFT